jgi:hypothetical protein
MFSKCLVESDARIGHVLEERVDAARRGDDKDASGRRARASKSVSGSSGQEDERARGGGEWLAIDLEHERSLEHEDRLVHVRVVVHARPSGIALIARGFEHGEDAARHRARKLHEDARPARRAERPSLAWKDHACHDGRRYGMRSVSDHVHAPPGTSPSCCIIES